MCWRMHSSSGRSAPAPALQATSEVRGHVIDQRGSIFNLLNAGYFQQFTDRTADATYSPNFLQMRSRQNPRALQLTIVARF